MARKHDLTALLPFPTRLAQPDHVEPQVPRLRHRDDPTSLSRGLVQLDQLDLTAMVRHHAAPALALAVVRTRPVAGRSVEATRESSSSDGAVPSPGFYLDLIGAVTVMALVLLAAILV